MSHHMETISISNSDDYCDIPTSFSSTLETGDMLFEGLCPTTKGWFDVCIIDFKKGRCKVAWENMEDYGTEWIDLESIRRRSLPVNVTDARLKVGATIVAFLKRETHIYYDATITAIDKQRHEKQFQVQYTSGPQSGVKEWLGIDDICLSDPSSVITLETARMLFPAGTNASSPEIQSEEGAENIQELLSNTEESSDKILFEAFDEETQAWYDARILAVDRHKCQVMWENVNDDEITWISPGLIRARSFTLESENDDRLVIGATILAFLEVRNRVAPTQEETTSAHFEATITAIDRQRPDGARFQAEFRAGPRAGRKLWTSINNICLSDPSSYLTLAKAEKLFPRLREAPCPSASAAAAGSCGCGASAAAGGGGGGRSDGDEFRADREALRAWLHRHLIPAVARARILSVASSRNTGAVEAILSSRAVAEGGGDGREYLIKWADCSHRKCRFVPRRMVEHIADSLLWRFERARSGPGGAGGDAAGRWNGIRAEWLQVDRVVREGEDGREVLVKWKGLGYDRCTWEAVEDLLTELDEVEKLRRRLDEYRSRARRKGLVPVGELLNHGAGCIEGGKPSDHRADGVDTMLQKPSCIQGGKLSDHQVDGVDWMLQKHKDSTSVIFCEGSRKEMMIQIAAFVGAIKANMAERLLRPFLIVAPLSTLQSWKQHFARWCPQVNVVGYRGSMEARVTTRDCEFDPEELGVQSFEVLLTSYEIARVDARLLVDIKWEVMIVDEGCTPKDGLPPNFFQAFDRYQARQRIIVSGPQLQNNLKKLLNMMGFLDRDDAGMEKRTFPNLEQFERPQVRSTLRKNIATLKSMLSPYVFRRCVDDHGSNVLSKIERVVLTRLTTVQREMYTTILSDNHRVLRALSKVPLTNMLMHLRKCCNHAIVSDGAFPSSGSSSIDAQSRVDSFLAGSGKMQFLESALPELRRKGHRVLIFSQFTAFLDELEIYLEARGFSFQRLDGSVNGKERQRRIDAFNEPESSIFSILLSTQEAGLVLDLTTADTVILFDSDFNPLLNMQIMNRAHRIGECKDFLVLRLVSFGTVEEKILEVARKKLKVESTLMKKLNISNCRVGFSKTDLYEILRHGAEAESCEKKAHCKTVGKAKPTSFMYDTTNLQEILCRDSVIQTVGHTGSERQTGVRKDASWTQSLSGYISKTQDVNSRKCRPKPFGSEALEIVEGRPESLEGRKRQRTAVHPMTPTTQVQKSNTDPDSAILDVPLALWTSVASNAIGEDTCLEPEATCLAPEYGQGMVSTVEGSAATPLPQHSHCSAALTSHDIQNIEMQVPALDLLRAILLFQGPSDSFQCRALDAEHHARMCPEGQSVIPEGRDERLSLSDWVLSCQLASDTSELGRGNVKSLVFVKGKSLEQYELDLSREHVIPECTTAEVRIAEANSGSLSPWCQARVLEMDVGRGICLVEIAGECRHIEVPLSGRFLRPPAQNVELSAGHAMSPQADRADDAGGAALWDADAESEQPPPEPREEERSECGGHASEHRRAPASPTASDRRGDPSTLGSAKNPLDLLRGLMRSDPGRGGSGFRCRVLGAEFGGSLCERRRWVIDEASGRLFTSLLAWVSVCALKAGARALHDIDVAVMEAVVYKGVRLGEHRKALLRVGDPPAEAAASARASPRPLEGRRHTAAAAAATRASSGAA